MIDMVMVRARLNREVDEKGFTLIELIIAMLIFAILAAVAIPIYMNQQKAATEQQINIALTNASIILKQEHAGANGRYPTMLPADVIIPNEISMVYTHSKNQDMYCLEASYAGDSDSTRYLKGDDEGNSEISETECTYTSTGPAAPVLSGDINTANEPMLSWSAISGATSYTVENITSGDTFTVTSGTSWTGDLMTVPESFRVVAHADSARSDASNVVRLTPPSIKPTSTPILTIRNVSGNDSQRSGTLHWNPIKWADDYVVMNADTNTELWRGSAYTLDVSAKIGETLRIYLVAINDTGQSPQSNVVTLTGPSPTAPNLNLTTTTSSAGTTAKLTWNSVPGATKYHLFKNGSRISTNATSGMTDLVGWNNGAIHYHVTPVAASGMTGDRSNEVSFDSTMPNPSIPGTPTGEYGKFSTPPPTGSLWGYTVKWNSTDFAQNYQAQYRINSGAWTNGTISTSTSLGIHINPGDKLEVRVRASNYAGTSGWSGIHTYSHIIEKPKIISTSRSGQNISITRATCNTVDTSPLLQYRHNASGSITGWVTAPSMSFTVPVSPLYGHPTKAEVRVYCVSDHDSTHRSLDTDSRTWTIAARAIPAPSGGTIVLDSVRWSTAEGSAVVPGRTIFSEQCPAGTTLEWSHRHGSQPLAWIDYSPWVSANDRSKTQTIDFGGVWGGTSYLQVQGRCVSNGDSNVTSTVSVANNGGSAQVLRPIPAAQNISISMLHTTSAHLTAQCPQGTFVEWHYIRDDQRMQLMNYVGEVRGTISHQYRGVQHRATATCVSSGNSYFRGPTSGWISERYG